MTAAGSSRLIYVHDPMCSWCWAFRPTLDSVLESIGESLDTSFLLGGLAADTDEPMPQEMQENLQATWRRIQEHVPGTRFDFGFWTDNQPKRATFRACRAVIAARAQEKSLERPMIDAIQRAYYLDRRNPSERDVLIDLAGELGCDSAQFAADLDDTATRQTLDDERTLAGQLGAQGFPSLFLIVESTLHSLPIDHRDPQPTLHRISELMA